jgi:phospholipid/cholesterol/gamma-HCH transport system substrate-binding protein
VRAEMKSFAERNSLIIGAVGIAATAGLTVAALEYDKLPFVSSGTSYSAYFAEAGGLTSGAAVEISGFRVGQVKTIDLDGPRVLVAFKIDEDVDLGERTEASIKTKTLLGAKILEVRPRGEGHLNGTIPVERTTSPYQLPDALGDLAMTLSGLNTSSLSDSLATLAQTFAKTPPDFKRAAEGVARFTEALDAHDAQLRKMLENANKSTKVLAERTDRVVGLIGDSNELLVALRRQSSALDSISGNISSMATQLRGFITDNKPQLKPALDKLNDLLTILSNRKAQIKDALPRLNQYALSLGECVASGPYFNAYIADLLPGQFIQPFVDAAFSDLGLDPNTLLPSQRIEPPVGKPGTPLLPMPYPRTGQGGEPRLNLPDAITGKPGDPRYPYRQPPPAPPPGGPPPGPPAPAPPDLAASVPDQKPPPIYVPAPHEGSPPTAPGGGR